MSTAKNSMIWIPNKDRRSIHRSSVIIIWSMRLKTENVFFEASTEPKTTSILCYNSATS